MKVARGGVPGKKRGCLPTSLRARWPNLESEFIDFLGDFRFQVFVAMFCSLRGVKPGGVGKLSRRGVGHDGAQCTWTATRGARSANPSRG